MAAFGSEFCGHVARASFADGSWSAPVTEPLGKVALHPGSHGLHYGSTCFEGLKAFRHADGSVHVFQLDRHVARMRHSAEVLNLPVPDAEQFHGMVLSVVDAARSVIPETPGALYLRPLLLGTLESVGAAAHASTQAEMIVMACPVGDYFTGGVRPLRVALADRERTAPGFGWAKTGANYASALGPVIRAREAWGADQVLFCPGGEVRETGAANFLLIDDGVIRTKGLDDTILHGVTRASILALAPSLGLQVDESAFGVDELMERIPHAEAALSGTAAIVAPVGVLIRDGEEHVVGHGAFGPVTARIREALTAIQFGTAPDDHGWLTAI